MRPILIAGPTASGKSALALALAERDGGVVVNADALQVYACWRVLTARPSDADLACAPHRLYGHVPCDAPYSVGAWLAEATAALAEARAAGRRPIVVGGTGLYFEALTRGLAVIPPTPPEVRARAMARLAEGGRAALEADLARDDPETLAGLDRRNPMRLMRAWEVVAATGRGLAAWRRDPAPPALPLNATAHVVVEVDKSRLANIIRARIDKMIEAGAVDECRRFLAGGHDLAAPSGRAIGAAELAAFLDGRLPLDAAREAMAIATRQYAKRQRSWLRNRMADWPRIDAGGIGNIK
ncbi:tRNA (adenosine(37)-N6)-dimethylallyltransferase MiaA [Amaricoccus sp.]|uniref:tRNA (adenosine(37)-N6)-dimethylallyltransferase MiaA n=1 Tax=Amaricoccus sp. TaxID=1872485 RepID=UPI001B6922BE|nr:tRNA (adenosine(37)-N6)-dimethylallyltransferase MiaA [Amaricoccus sp.]MBP7000907.1 tRNA (adenosine(37)-N6)-dimethylallyltransferase MiaA [Amaricoccus sp.]